MIDAPELGQSEQQQDPERKDAAPWQTMILDAEKAFGFYQDKCDNVEKHYATLERLSGSTREREFQMFWANVQVLAPSVYSRPPVPVVVPRFRDRRPLYRTASELLERASTVAFERAGMDEVMHLTRDDMIVVARGAVWVRYEKRADGEPEKVCIEHVHRRDFLHEAARNWTEVGWVAKRSWLTKAQMKDRFDKWDGEGAAFEVRRDEVGDETDNKLKAGVWEIWHKGQNKVVWVTEGVEKTLDEQKPHLDLEGFFPCPRPAYGTVQRGSLVPVPDMLLYKDQLEEINELTARISVLSEAIKVRAFYPAGSGEIADAIETAIRTVSDNAVLVPISNWNMLGNGSVKDMLVWLPIDVITAAVEKLVQLRRQLIDDVYQITGLSDIMRGSTEASETLGAQQLKSQYGSIRIRDRQEELVRLARDTVRIAAEIMSENFQGRTLADMAQSEIPTDAEIAKEIKPLTAQRDEIMRMVQQAAQDPRIQQLAQTNPQEAQQVVQAAQQEISGIEARIGELKAKPTLEKIVKLLRDERVRPFALDIETDSTIAPDENAQKQRATEYIQGMGQFLGASLPILEKFPQAAPMIGETLKFIQSQFRVGRQMDTVVDEFVEKMQELASQPRPDPEHGQADAEAQAMQMKAQTEQAKAQSDMEAKRIEAQTKMLDAQIRQREIEAKVAQAEAETSIKVNAAAQEAQMKAAEAEQRRQAEAEKHRQSMEKGALELIRLQKDIERMAMQPLKAEATA